jgi:quinol monooxygenase YgiN
MVGLELLVKIHTEKRAEFIQLFELLKTSKDPMNSRHEMELFERINAPDVFLWREHWENGQSLDQYYKKNEFRSMIGAISILGKLLHKKTFSFEEGDQDV